MIATVVHLPVLRCDSPAGIYLRVSRRGYDTELAARSVGPAEHPGMLSVHDVIRISYPIAGACPPLITTGGAGKLPPHPFACTHVQIDETRRAVLPRAPRLLEQQKGICFLCNQPMIAGDAASDALGPPNLHHVIPASRGGRGLPANKVLTHVKCNGQYGNREPAPVHLDKLVEIFGRHAALATVYLWLARYPAPVAAGKRKLHAILTDWSKANG
jgi:hypothetical protein